MRRFEEEAIVLDAELAGEADRRALLLTERGELVRALAPAAARSRRRFGAALQPGARVRARWILRAEGAPAILEEAQLLAAPPAPDPLERYYAVAHLLETSTLFAQEGAEEPRLFRLLGAVLEQLAAGADLDPLLRYFEAWALRLAGLLPELQVCASCGASLARRSTRIAGERGSFCAGHAPPGARALSAGAAAWLAETRRRAPDALPAPSAAAARELAQALPGLISEFTERPLRAWSALARRRREPSALRGGAP